MNGITKRFGSLRANDQISFDVRAGEIHAILGENGAGKTTLMNILYGLYEPQEGEIIVKGNRRRIGSPQDAIKLGIGMVHQHFMLIPVLTVAQNIIIGLPPSRGPFINQTDAELKVEELAKRHGLKVDPRAKVWQLSVGAQQRVEIIKTLYRGAFILVLDEPTAVLTPQEAQDLFSILRSLTAEGKSIVFISHKLEEVLGISNRVTVLRNGKSIATFNTQETNETELARTMVGREVFLRTPKKSFGRGAEVLRVKNLSVDDDKGLPAVKNLSLSVREGEILGLAGVDGNGQSELAQVITGLRKAKNGNIFIGSRETTNCSPLEVMKEGVAHIPQERKNVGLILDFNLKENLILHNFRAPPFSRYKFLNLRAIDQHATQLISSFGIKASSPNLMGRQLSGGNQQKLILARELSRAPKLLVAVQPTRGLDIGATEYIHSKLIEHRDRGAGILLISTDLNEILSLSDMIAVISGGEIMGTLATENADIEAIGLMMAGIQKSLEPMSGTPSTAFTG